MDIFTLHILNSFHSQQQVVVFIFAAADARVKSVMGVGEGRTQQRIVAELRTSLGPDETLPQHTCESIKSMIYI